MKDMKEQISKMKDEVFNLATTFKEMDANHCKIKEDCEKRELKLTTLQKKHSILAKEITCPITGIKLDLLRFQQTNKNYADIKKRVIRYKGCRQGC